MKMLNKLRRKKGFTLVECIVSMAIFALMSAIVMQILAISLAQHRRNHVVEKDMDAQIQNIVNENALVERETADIAMKFVNASGGSMNTVTIKDVNIQRNESENGDRLELNTLDVNIMPDENGGNKNNQGAGMVTDDIHIYGTKGCEEVYVKGTDTVANGIHTILLDFQVYTNDSVISQAESCAIKVALPVSSKGIVVTPDSTMAYSMLTSTTVRFNDKDFNSKETTYTMHIKFTLTEEQYDKEYVSFAKYFIKPDSESTATAATFSDTEVPGIYNTLK